MQQQLDPIISIVPCCNKSTAKFYTLFTSFLFLATLSRADSLLCNVAAGGGTVFRVASAEGARLIGTERLKELNVLDDNPANKSRPGLRILPVQGRAVVFWCASS